MKLSETLPKKIEVKPDLFTYHLANGEFLCDHNSISIIKACCSTIGTSGYIECGCNGRDEMVCENGECTGLTDEDMESSANECWD